MKMKKILTRFLILTLIINLFAFALNTTALPVSAEMVMYNTKTGKYHTLTCKWAKKCTVNCIKIDKKEAKKRGGVPCKVCGG